MTQPDLLHFGGMTHQLAITCLLILILLWGVPVAAPADRAIELSVLAAISQNHRGVFEILMMW